MFRIPVALAVLLLLVSAAPALAVVIEIPLPALNGSYGAERTVPLVLPAAPSVIYGASFRVTGTAQVGSLICYNTQTGNYDLPAVWPAEVFIYAHDGSHSKSWYLDELVGTTGPIALEKVARPLSGANWNFLLDGVGAVTFHGGGAGYITICSSTSAPPTVTVTEAVLILDAEFPVAIESSTWGRIKALYR